MIQTSVKSRFLLLLCLFILSFATLPTIASATEDGESLETTEAPSTAEQVKGLEAMCAAHSEEMAAHPPEGSLYERIGGRDKIHEIVVEIVRRHNVNKPLLSVMKNVNEKRLIDNVTDFLVVGSGGPGEYRGLDMADAHEHLKLTNEHFLAAGSDVMEAMRTSGCGEAEIQEVVCMLVSLRSEVVIASEKVIP
jgi:hemoglobin